MYLHELPSNLSQYQSYPAICCIAIAIEMIRYWD